MITCVVFGWSQNGKVSADAETFFDLFAKYTRRSFAITFRAFLFALKMYLLSARRCKVAVSKAMSIETKA